MLTAGRQFHGHVAAVCYRPVGGDGTDGGLYGESPHFGAVWRCRTLEERTLPRLRNVTIMSGITAFKVLADVVRGSLRFYGDITLADEVIVALRAFRKADGIQHEQGNMHTQHRQPGIVRPAHSALRVHPLSRLDDHYDTR